MRSASSSKRHYSDIPLKPWFVRLFGRRRGHNEERITGNLRTMVVRIKGMHCGSCAANIEHFMKRQRGIVKARVDYSKSAGTIIYDADLLSKEEIASLPIFHDPSPFLAEVVEDREQRSD